MDKIPKLGEMLIEARLLTEEHVQTALSKTASSGERFGIIIQKLGFIKGEVLVGFLAGQRGLEIIDLDNMVIPENLVKKVPAALVEKYKFLPISFKDGVLTIALIDPTDYEAIEQIQLATNWRIEVVLATLENIERNIRWALSREEEDTDNRINVLITEKMKDPLVRLLIEKKIIAQEDLIRQIKNM
jgi:type IV pilus assembly protein PilB